MWWDKTTNWRSAGMTMRYFASRPLPKKVTYWRNVISNTIYFDSLVQICSLCSNTLLEPHARSCVQRYLRFLRTEHITCAQHDSKRQWNTTSTNEFLKLDSALHLLVSSKLISSSNYSDFYRYSKNTENNKFDSRQMEDLSAHCAN